MTNPASEYPLVHPKSKKRYRLVEIDGQEMWEYESGAVYDPVGRRLRKGIASPITPENARELQAKGQEKIRQDLLNGMRKAVASKQGIKLSEVTGSTVREALGQAAMEHALAGNYVPGIVSARRLAAELGDMLPQRNAKVQDAQGNEISGDPAFVERVLSAIERARKRQGDGNENEDS